MTNKSELPEGWQMKKLGEVCQVLDGLRKPINSAERQNRIAGKARKELFPYYGATGQVGWIDGFLTDGEYVLIGEDGAPFFDFYKAKAYAIRGKSWVNNHAHILQEKEGVSSNEFILHYLNSLDYHGHVNGTTRLKLTKGSLVNIPFPLPPLTEQQAIVSKIEALFSEIDKGIETLRTAQAQLKVFRQAVLNTAIIGETKHTIESVSLKLDQGWSPKCLNEASDNPDEWAVIKTTAIQAGYFLEKENKKLPKDLSPREQHELQVGDLLVTRAGPRVRVGVCCLIKRTRPKLLNCDKAYRVRIDSSVALPEYVEMLLNSPKYVDEIEKLKTGINDSGLNLTQKTFSSILIPLPPLSEQYRIVEEIEARLSVCDKMEETILESLQQAEALKQSILKRAFEGKLVAQQKHTRLIPLLPKPRPVVAEDARPRKALAGYIISRFHNDRHFGLVVFQKALHLAEYHSQVTYQTAYKQEAAGPLDKFIYRLKEEAKAQEWFSTYEYGHQQRFELGKNFPELMLDCLDFSNEKKQKLQSVFSLLKGATLATAELYSTVYAVWNNCIINGVKPDRDRVIREVYEWSDRKKENFSQTDIWDAKVKLETAGIVPVGFGQFINR